MNAELMPQKYFEHVQFQMIHIGFTLISRIEIDGTQCRYHIPARVARASTFFFHTVGKSFIVMLRYYEHVRDACSRHEGYWVATVYIRFKPYRILLEENLHWLDDVDSEPYHDLPVLGSTDLTIDGFRYHTGVSLERDTENEQVGLRFEQADGFEGETITATDLARRIRDVFNVVEKYLDRNPFYRLRLTDFVPHYCFSGESWDTQTQEKLEHLFWSKFDWSYFKHLVVMAYGYNYHLNRHKVEAK